MLSRYSTLRTQPWRDRPEITVAVLETRYQDARKTWYEHVRALLKASFAAEATLERPTPQEDEFQYYAPSYYSKRDRDQQLTTRTDSERAIDATFCAGLGTFHIDDCRGPGGFTCPSHIRASEFWDVTVQLIMLEAIRDLLSQDFGFKVGVSYIQDPMLNQVDITFLESHGHKVIRSLETDMTNQSLLLAPCLMLAITSGMVADFQPKIYVGTWCPTLSKEHSRDWSKLQVYMDTHEGRVFDFMGTGRYKLWTPKSISEYFK